MVAPVLIKFGGLLIRTLTKPIANRIKEKAALNRDGWLHTVCLRYGQFHHKMESTWTLRLAGHKAKSIKPVSEEAAVALGATVASEVFIFTVAGSILGFEIWKKDRDDEIAKKQKEAATAKEKRELEERFKAMEIQVSHGHTPSHCHKHDNREQQYTFTVVHRHAA